MSDDFDSFSDDDEMNGEINQDFSEIPRKIQENSENVSSDDSFFDDTQNSTNYTTENNTLNLPITHEEEIDEENFYQDSLRLNNENFNDNIHDSPANNAEEESESRSQSSSSQNHPVLPSLKKKLEPLSNDHQHQQQSLPTLSSLINSPKERENEDGFKFQTAQDTSVYEETQPKQPKIKVKKVPQNDLIYTNAPSRTPLKPLIQKPLTQKRNSQSQMNKLPPVTQSAPTELQNSSLHENSSSLSRSPGSSSPNSATNNDDNDGNSQKSKEPQEEVSIIEFDPTNPSKITEPISKSAMKNLGISFSDLCYPSDQELSKYEDSELRSIVKSKLEHRVDNAIRDVAQERQRLIKRNQQNTIMMTRSAPPELNNNDNFIELERARMAKLQHVRNKSVEQVIFSLVMMNKNDEIQEQEERRMEEFNRLRQQKIEEKKKKEDEKVTKVFEEKENLINQKTMKNALVVEQTKQRLDSFEQKKQQEEIERKRKFEEIELERQRHKIMAEDLERKEREEKEKNFLEKSLFEQSKMGKFREMKTQELKQQRIKSQQRSEEERKRVLEAQKKVDELIDKKREKTEQKIQRQEKEFEKIMEQREQKRSELKERELIKINRAKQNKKEIDQNDQQRKEEKILTIQQKSIEAQKQQEIERKRHRFSELTLNELKHEDQRIILERRERQRQQLLKEQEEQYQQRMYQLQNMQNQREMMRMKNQRLRVQLEMEKEKMLETTMGNNAGLKRTSSDKLRKLAESMGINYDAIEQRAMKMSRQRNTRSVDSINERSRK